MEKKDENTGPMKTSKVGTRDFVNVQMKEYDWTSIKNLFSKEDEY